VLLDNQSTILNDIRTSDTHMDIHCSAGIVSTNLIGDAVGYGTAWYHPKGIANILLPSQVLKHGFCFSVQPFTSTTQMEQHRFFTSPRGLFYTDITTDPRLSELALISTVDDNKSRYLSHDYFHAVLAGKIQQIIDHPSTRNYLRIVEHNLFQNPQYHS
jgi:hypothetical protein